MGKSLERRRRAVAFVEVSLEPIRALPFATLDSWPDWPGKVPFDLRVPDDLAPYKFTLMKDTLPSGEIRIAIQAHRPAVVIAGEMWAIGFAMSSDGAVRPLTQEDDWDLT
jgi:hypothetical protein